MIELEISSTDRQVDLLAEGFDCVLRVGAQPDQTVVARLLCRLPMINCASAAYLQRYGVPQTLADLAHHHLVHCAPVGLTFGGVRVPTGQQGAAHSHGRAGPACNSTDAYRVACLGGFGITQVPALGIRELLASGALVAVLPDYPAPPLDVSLLYAGAAALAAASAGIHGLVGHSFTVAVVANVGGGLPSTCLPSAGSEEFGE